MLKIRAFLIVILLIGLVPLLALNFFEYRRDLAEQERRIFARNLEVANTVAVGFRSFIRRAVAVEEVAGQAITQAQLDESEIEDFLRRVIPASRGIDVICYADPEGRILASAPRRVRKIPPENLKKIRAGARSAVSDLRPVGKFRAEFHVTVGVREGGRLLAVVDGTIGDRTVFDFISIRIGRRGNLGVIDTQGRAAALSFKRNLTWEQRNRKFIISIARALKGRPATTGPFKDPLGDIERMGASVPIKPIGWVANVFQPVDEVFGPVRNAALAQAILSFLISAGALGVVFVLARLITDPIERLATQSEPLREGKFDHRLPTDFRIVELVELAEALNMTNAEIRRLFESEQHIATTLQSELLPVEPPKLPGFDVGTYYASATERALVGGDFYDFIPLSKEKLAVVIGDIQGKGVEAAVSTVTTKFALRNLLAQSQSPDWVLSGLNSICRRELEADQFITLVLLILDSATGDITYAGAGHHPPLICEATACRELTENGTALGLLEGAEYGVGKDRLLPGETLVLYTDGLIEARSNKEFFGVDRMIEVVSLNKHLDAQALSQKIYVTCLDFAQAHLVDDIALVVIKREPRGTT